MAAKQLLFDEAARQALLKGVNKLAKAATNGQRRQHKPLGVLQALSGNPKRCCSDTYTYHHVDQLAQARLGRDVTPEQ